MYNAIRFKFEGIDLEELSKLRKVYFEWKDNSNGITGPQLGIIAQDIKKLYPEIVVDMDSMGYDYTDIIFIRSITANGIKSASTAKARAQSYSSGGGGFSSGGGGGGSFGGGGGGGGFR